MHVREVRDGERAWLRATLRARWGDEIVVGRGRVHEPAELDAFVAVDDGGERVGLATYVVEGETAELVTIDALRAGAGVGRRLLEAVVEAARAAGAARLLVMTTNDNLAALRFYQRAGFRLLELRPGAVDEARSLKPAIPATGNDDIPIRDEIDLVLDLSAARARSRGSAGERAGRGRHGRMPGSG
jgi:ribosomal protein S18 acetylase RimI-like enzyme